MVGSKTGANGKGVIKHWVMLNQKDILEGRESVSNLLQPIHTLGLQ